MLWCQRSCKDNVSEGCESDDTVRLLYHPMAGYWFICRGDIDLFEAGNNDILASFETMPEGHDLRGFLPSPFPHCPFNAKSPLTASLGLPEDFEVVAVQTVLQTWRHDQHQLKTLQEMVAETDLQHEAEDAGASEWPAAPDDLPIGLPPPPPPPCGTIKAKSGKGKDKAKDKDGKGKGHLFRGMAKGCGSKGGRTKPNPTGWKERSLRIAYHLTLDDPAAALEVVEEFKTSYPSWKFMLEDYVKNGLPTNIY